MFCAVAIHELAHAMMDGERSHDLDYRTTWQWLTDRFDDGQKDIFCVPPDHVGQRCDDGGRTGGENMPRVRRIKHVLEESLANAFALRQRFSDGERIAVTAFVSGQSPPYRAGLNWLHLDDDALAQTARSWSRFRRDLPGPTRNTPGRLKRVYEEGRTPLELLADRLASKVSKPISGPVDFEADFLRHLAARLPAWQAEYQKCGENNYDDRFLNYYCGVYERLAIHADHVGDDKLVLALLVQWENNGRHGAAACGHFRSLYEKKIAAAIARTKP